MFRKIPTLAGFACIFGVVALFVFSYTRSLASYYEEMFKNQDLPNFEKLEKIEKPFSKKAK